MPRSSSRLTSLDVFRGLTIAGMILVNNPGSWRHMYPPLRHAAWNGWTPTDLIFPFFLFIVGVSLSYSLSKHLSKESRGAGLYVKIVRRTGILIVLGYFLRLFPHFRFENLRIPGVLMRIAVCYLLASLLYLKVGSRGRAAAAVLCLALYWALMKLVPVPGYGAGVLDLQGNLAGWLDTQLMGGHLYKPEFDPEGLLSTVPALATVLIGSLTGDGLRSRMTRPATAAGLFIGGLALALSGLTLSPYFPINKQLWSPTFVLFTAGSALLVLGACYVLVDIRDVRGWSVPFQILGVNAISVYAVSILAAKLLILVLIPVPEGHMALQTFIFQRFLVPWAGQTMGSLLFAVLLLLLLILMFYPLYKKRIHIKV